MAPIWPLERQAWLTVQEPGPIGLPTIESRVFYRHVSDEILTCSSSTEYAMAQYTVNNVINEEKSSVCSQKS